MKGRDKCELLNEVRQKIAEKNNIEFTIYDCTFEGDCTGTCPKCESEVRYLEGELAKKQARGEKINLEGIFNIEETRDTCIDISHNQREDGMIEIPPLDGMPVESPEDTLKRRIDELRHMINELNYSITEIKEDKSFYVSEREKNELIKKLEEEIRKNEEEIEKIYKELEDKPLLGSPVI